MRINQSRNKCDLITLPHCSNRAWKLPTYNLKLLLTLLEQSKSLYMMLEMSQGFLHQANANPKSRCRNRRCRAAALTEWNLGLNSAV